ncbi:MAG TPA: SDR family oxidoreductase [Pricia antarctica]|uniref:SDR family oxidoreductase n=2 Tax=root TaxID=1 RepID=A0A831QQK9_9FLAO|nr:SDR family oxidoreductase [Pricia antarctica]
MKNTIAILGCGWLGWPLAKTLIKDGFKIHGSTTSKEKLTSLSEDGIHPFTITLSEDAIEGDIEGFLSNVDTLIINVPPKLRGDHKENYIIKMGLLNAAVKSSNVKKVVFVSSTSVYGDVDGDVTEKTTPVPVTESGRQLLDSENIFREDSSLKVTIVRFGGLLGPERHPVTMLSGKKNLSNGNFPINLIHLNDCIKIISEILKNNWWNETINGVYPSHPTKQKYYTSKAIEKGLQIPEYETNTLKIGKIVSSYILTNSKDFKFTTTL